MKNPTRALNPDSGAKEIEATAYAGWYQVTVTRADATLTLRPYQNDANVYYACTPSKNAEAVRQYLIDSKAEQKSTNVF